MDTEGASLVRWCKYKAKLSGQWTLAGRFSGKQRSTEGANRNMPVNLSGL
jgi:hypothetical protein